MVSDASSRPAAAERPASDHAARHSRYLWLVHLVLLASAAAALVTLDFLAVRNAIHAVVGFVFVGFVVIHLVQRRATIARMLRRLSRVRSVAERRLRLTASDVLLAFLTLNVLVSGVIDWNRGYPVQFPLPNPFGRWHFDSGALLVIYLVVHVWRRRRRLRRSVIR
jgi:hypothetical protein